MKAKQLIRDIHRLEEQIKHLNEQLASDKQRLQEFFDKKGIKSLDAELNEPSGYGSKSLVAKKVERVYITYLVDKLKEKLPADTYDEVVYKLYSVKDIDGLVKLLKAHSIKPKQFKQFLDVSIKPNVDALKQLYAVGDISKKDLDGCYTAKIVKSIQIKEKSGTN